MKDKLYDFVSLYRSPTNLKMILSKEVLYLRWHECYLRDYFETLMTLLQS